MKNIIKIFTLSSVFLVMYSCSEERFDVRPDDLDTAESIFNNEKNYRLLVDGAYDAFKSPTYYNGDTGSSIILGDILADNLIINPEGRFTNRSAYEWSFSQQSSSVTALYSSAYYVISRANIVLDNLNKVPYTNYMKNIEAEAKAIRAIAHFDLVRAYAKIPTQSADAPGSLGIAYMTTFDPNAKPSRDATVSITYDKIIADLEDALSKIDDYKTTVGIGKLNKTSVLGYLSKVYLYKGDYAKSVEYGEQAINLSGAGAGARANFVKIWRDASDDGVLFKLLNANSGQDNVNIGVAYNQNSGGIRSESNISYDLYQKYSISGVDDIRKEAYILTANYDTTPYNNVIKYRTREGIRTVGVVDVKMLRVADVYLTVAESYMKSSIPNPVRALELLNLLRVQRYKDYVLGTETGTALLDAIYYERRLELAFENDRFWTLKRLGLPVIRGDYGSGVNGGGTDAPKGATKMLPAGNYRFVLPIPQEAINLNPNMVQNPDY